MSQALSTLSSMPAVRLTPRRMASLTALSFLGLVMQASSAMAAPVPTTRMNVDTVPQGAQVYLVEGEVETFQGNTPLSKVKLPRGTIKLRFKLAAHEPLDQVIKVGTTTQSLVFNLTRAVVPGSIDLQCADEFRGAKVRVDGRDAGTLPLVVSVMPGRHQVEVSKEGYQDWSKWVDTEEGQRSTFDVLLLKKEAPKGEILVTSSPSGASVTVNGSPRGVTPTVIESLTPGPYLVEVSLDDYGKESQTVQVEPAKRAIFDAPLKKLKGDTGEIKVLADVDDATVYLDGEAIGKSPVTQTGVRPGSHHIEARSPRGFYAEATVEVKAGEVSVVRLKMVAAAPPDRSTVKVISTTSGATASIDGGEAKAVPATFAEVEPGTHVVTVEAPGHALWKRTITVERGATQEVVAELEAVGRIEVRTRDNASAELFLNGKPIGSTPFVGDVPVGTHTLLVQRADGAQEQFPIAVSSDRVVTVTAAFGADKPTPVILHRPMPFSARSLSQGRGHVSLILSWPFPLAAQAGGGIGHGMDINIQLRTAFNVINELEGSFKWTFVDSKTLAAAAELGLGGGLGGSDRNSFVLRPALKGSLLIGDKAAITSRVGILFHSDRLAAVEGEPARGRDNGVRLYLGLDVEFQVSNSMNLAFSLQGDPVGGQRKLYEESFLTDFDPKIYFSGAASFMF
jgi:hypothetical protein